MTYSRNQGVRANHHMVADIDLADIEDRQVEIAGEVITNKDILPAIAAERFCYPHALTYRTQHLLQVLILRGIVGAVNRVIQFTLTNSLAFARNHLRVCKRIRQPCVAFFQFGHAYRNSLFICLSVACGRMVCKCPVISR